MALVDLDSFYVAGYFEETKLSHIHIGMPATMHIMGEVHSMQGHVQRLSAALEDRKRTTASGALLGHVKHTLRRVGLAPPIAVRIASTHVSPGLPLTPRPTATLALEEDAP